MKILIVDDDRIKQKAIHDLVEFISGGLYGFNYYYANNFESGKMFLNEYFPIILIDYNLGSKENGLSLITLYKNKWQDSMCFLYSAFSDFVNSEISKTINCCSYEELSNELSIALMTLDLQPRPKESATMIPQQHQHTLVSKELCDTLHKENSKDHARMEARQEETVQTIKDVRDDFKEAVNLLTEKLEKSVEKISIKLDGGLKKFEDSNTQGRNMFWAMIVFGGGVMGVCVTLAIKAFFIH